MNKQQNYSTAVLIPAQPGAFISVNWLRHIYTGTVENRMSSLATSSSSKLEGKIIVFNSLFLNESLSHFSLIFWRTAYSSTSFAISYITPYFSPYASASTMLKVYSTFIEIQGLCAMIHLLYVFLSVVQKTGIKQVLELKIHPVNSSIKVDADTLW